MVNPGKWDMRSQFINTFTKVSIFQAKIKYIGLFSIQSPNNKYINTCIPEHSFKNE